MPADEDKESFVSLVDGDEELEAEESFLESELQDFELSTFFLLNLQSIIDYELLPMDENDTGDDWMMWMM